MREKSFAMRELLLLSSVFIVVICIFFTGFFYSDIGQFLFGEEEVSNYFTGGQYTQQVQFTVTKEGLGELILHDTEDIAVAKMLFGRQPAIDVKKSGIVMTLPRQMVNRNGVYTLFLQMHNGEEGTAIVEVDGIDTSPPLLTVATNIVNDEILLTVSTQDHVSDTLDVYWLEGNHEAENVLNKGTLITDTMTVYEEGVTYTFATQDAAGNKSSLLLITAMRPQSIQNAAEGSGENAKKTVEGYEDLVLETRNEKQFGNWVYRESNMGAVITGYLGETKQLHIPSIVDGLPVLRIADSSFINRNIEEVVIDGSSEIGVASFQNNKIKRLILSDSIEKIGAAAFRENAIEEVVLPKSLTHLGYESFAANYISSITIPEKIEVVQAKAFLRNNLTNVTFEGKNVVVEYAAFSDNLLTYVEFKGNVISIGEQAFSYNKIESVSIQEGVEMIGKGAFYNNKLKEIVLPSSLKVVGTEAFGKNNLHRARIQSPTIQFNGRPFGDTDAEFSLEAVEGHDAVIKHAERYKYKFQSIYTY